MMFTPPTSNNNTSKQSNKNQHRNHHHTHIPTTSRQVERACVLESARPLLDRRLHKAGGGDVISQINSCCVYFSAASSGCPTQNKHQQRRAHDENDTAIEIEVTLAWCRHEIKRHLERRATTQLQNRLFAASPRHVETAWTQKTKKRAPNIHVLQVIYNNTTPQRSGEKRNTLHTAQRMVD